MLDNIYDEICTFDNLYKGFQKVSEDGKSKSATIRFSYNLEENLIQIQNELLWGTYEIGDFFTFIKYEPKRREINALPYKDRVVQSALCLVIEPYISKKFIYDSFACRPEKGLNEAAKRMSYFLKKKDTEFFLKCDISKYFDSIDLDIAFNLYKAEISDIRTLSLIYKILHKDNPDKGIRIGNRLSQLTANLVLHELDFYVKQVLKVKYYVRYMDDFIILGHSKRELNAILRQIRQFLADKLHLTLNKKTCIGMSEKGFEFIGYKFYKNHKVIKKQTANRARRFVKSWEKGKVSNEKFVKSMASICGHAVHSTNYTFYMRLLLRALRFALGIKD